MIAIPPKLDQRPKYKGLPIPFIALMKPDGDPDFRATDEAARRVVIFERRCQLCGGRLGRNLFFVGGPQAAACQTYFEPAAHLECIIYAMQVCPFIAGKLEHAAVADVQADNPGIAIRADETFSPVKSELWVIVKAQNFRLVRTHGGTLLIQLCGNLFKTQPIHASTTALPQWMEICRELFHARLD